MEKDRRSWFLFNGFTSICVVTLISLLCGCAATHTAINKRNMDIQTKMSSSIFLDPVLPSKHTVYLQIRNTSDKPELDLEKAMIAAMADKGYTIVQNPEEANYLLQANILQVGRSDLRAAEHALHQGFGAAIGGAALGAALGSTADSKHETKGAKAGGVLGAAVATVTDAMVQDVVYSVIADVQISERVANSVTVKEKTRSKLKQGTATTKELTSTETIAWKRYQTRVVSTANKVNLKFNKAVPELVAGLTRSIVGIF